MPHNRHNLSEPQVPGLLSPAHPDVTREHFIPLKKCDLAARLLAELPPAERAPFEDFARLLDAVIHHTYHERLGAFYRAYAPFDPDSDIEPAESFCAEQCEGQLHLLFDEFRELMRRANFVRLAEHDIHQAMAAASDWGVRLHVDHDAFEHLEVYARGDTVARRVRRRWRNLFRREVVEVPIYRRLAVALRLWKEEPPQHEVREPHPVRPLVFKLFKNVPKADIDMLLPGSYVKMTWLDRGKILFPTLSGLAMAAVKIAKGAVVFAFAGVYGLLAFLAFVAGTLGYGMKSFYGYLNTKDKYHLHLTRSLYYQNLDNNSGVLARLWDEAEEQDYRETLLAHVLLWRHAPVEGWTERQLDAAAETWLAEQLAMPVDFDVHDALSKLIRWNLVVEVAPARYRALDPHAASARLDALWDDWFHVPNPPAELSIAAGKCA